MKLVILIISNMAHIIEEKVVDNTAKPGDGIGEHFMERIMNMPPDDEDDDLDFSTSSGAFNGEE